MIRTLRRLSFLTGVALFAACAGDTSLPSAPNATYNKAPVKGLLVATATALTLATGVQRTTALPSNLTVSQAIGAGGGTLSIPQAGVTITVPAGALAVTTVISMTARAGTVIAYDFAPHGTTFAKPIVLTQALAGTNVPSLLAPLLTLGYYTDPSYLTTLGASVSEFISGSLNLVNASFTASITHFSGYMVACGRSG